MQIKNIYILIQQDKYTCHVFHIKIFTFYVQSIKENVIYRRKTNLLP